MVTSNSYDFILTRDEIVTVAYRLVGALAEGEILTSAQTTEGALFLNMIIKNRHGDGMPLWALKRGTILPFSGASSIATDSHVVTFYDSTTLSADAAALATAITIAAAGTIANSDQIGIELDNGDIHWTTVSAGGGTTALTLAAGITSAATSGNRVYAYTASADRIQKPIRITTANILLVSDGSPSTVDVLDLNDYFNLSNRTVEGVPNSIAYDHVSTVATNLNNGLLYVYPRFSTGDYVIEFTYQRPFQDFDAGADNPDFPQAFYLPIAFQLAAVLSNRMGLPIEERNTLIQQAHLYWVEALDSISPEASLLIRPADGR